jgi:hypothetical protein
MALAAGALAFLFFTIIIFIVYRYINLDAT